LSAITAVALGAKNEFGLTCFCSPACAATVVIGRQHVRDGVATLRTEKSQGEITVTLPILPVLQRTLDAGPIGDLAFICGKKGKPFKKESFGTAFKEACVAAGLHNRSAHGCRKIGATRAAENARRLPS
jgi:integrase